MSRNDYSEGSQGLADTGPKASSARIRPVLPNRRIGVIAPAGPPLDEDRLARGLRSLEARGLDLVRPRTSYPAAGFLAGPDGDRLSEFEAICRDEDIDVVMAVRGGYGTLRLLDQIDYALASARPRTLVGYSDITALQLALHHRAGWTGLSGPMVAGEWPEPSPAWESPLWALLAGDSPVSLAPVDGSTPRTLVRGKAEGKLLGGNLSMVTRLLGTPYSPDYDGALLFLEDVGEPPYRVDGMLAQLRLAGILDRISGVVLGAFTDSKPAPNRPTLTMDEVFADYFGGAGYPVVFNWNYGHFPVKTPMPIGIRAQMTAEPDRVDLRTTEPLVPQRRSEG